MKKLLFVCHGNICRSPMAEMICKEMARLRGLDQYYLADSAATSTEEIGNGIYPPAQAELRKHGIPVKQHHARQMTRADYNTYDHIFVMDRNNLQWLHARMPDIVQRQGDRYTDPQHKICKLMTLVGKNEDVADPWYTGNFHRTFRDITEALEAFFQKEEESATHL